MGVFGEADRGHVHRVKLGSQGMEVSAQGLGCMGMSFAFGPPKPEQEMIDLIRYAVIELGITFLDTANSYGLNEELLAKALKGIRDKVQLATKFGIHVENNRRVFRGDPEYVRTCCDQSLQRLQVDCIDLYYVHRIDVNVPIEVTMGELKKLVKEGKIKYVGLSDASAATIRRAHAVHPLTAVQLEWSLWTRELEYEVIPTCRELGIGIVSYSPLGRGFLAGGAKVVENMADNDLRNGLPRFTMGNLNRNKELFLRLNKISSRKGCTPAQLALAWLHHQGKDVIPIPGTTRRKYLEENVDSLYLQPKEKDIHEIDRIFPVKCAIGDRYADMSLTTVNSETITLSEWKKTSKSVVKESLLLEY